MTEVVSKIILSIACLLAGSVKGPTARSIEEKSQVIPFFKKERRVGIQNFLDVSSAKKRGMQLLLLLRHLKKKCAY